MEDRISRMAKSHCRLSGDELCYQQSYFICLKCRLIQLPPLCRPSASGHTRQTNEMDSLSNSFRGIGRDSRDFNPSGSWKGERSTDLHKLSQCNKGLERVTHQRRYNKPKSFMAEQEKLHQTDSYQRLPKPEANRVRYGHILHDKTPPDKQSRVKMKIHSVKPPNYGNQSRRGDRVFLLDERRNISLQPDSDLICKYIDMDCDKLKDRKRQITHEQAENVKFEEHKIQTDDTERNCFLKDDSILSSPKIQRRQMPKSVGFYIPNVGDETDTAVMAPGSRRDHFCRTHPRSRYLIRIHNGRGLVKQPGHHLDPLENVCRLRNRNHQRRELNDYLTVKVNLQPFRQTNGHPSSATPTGSEPPKTVRSSGEKCQPTKKSKMRAFKDAVIQTTTVTARAMGGIINGGPLLADNGEKMEKPESNSEEKDPCAPESEETPYVVSQMAKFKEETGNVSCARGRDLQNVLEEASANPSETQRSNALSEQQSLISEVNHKGEISTERREKHAEYRDPEIQSAAEELGEKKTSSSKDNAPSLGGRERGASSLKASGVSAEKDNISPENNAGSDTNTEGQPPSMGDNKMAAYLQANSEGKVNELDRPYRTDDSVAQNTIDAAVDKGTDNQDPLPAGPCTDSLTEKTMRDADGRGEHRVPQIEHHVNRDYIEDTLYGDTLSAEQRSSGSLGNEEALVGLDLEVRSNEHVQKGYLLDGAKAAQRDGGTLVKEGDESHESHKENEIQTGTENPGGLKSQEDNGSRSRQPLTTCANDSPSHTQRNEQSNSNNNHSSAEASGKTRKKRLSLSENSKVIIVVESRSEKIDIQKYLSERSSKHPIWQDTNSSRNEPDGASSDNQRKKICLILPEKPNGRETKRANKKIK